MRAGATNLVSCLVKADQNHDQLFCTVLCSARQFYLLIMLWFVRFSSGFPRLLENLAIFVGKFPGPGKSWKVSLVLKSPEIC